MKRDAPDRQWKCFGGVWIASILLVAQYILAFFVLKLPGWRPLQWMGWIVWGISMIFGIAPIFILRQKGGVAKGKSYVETTRLVDTSLYAIVRHPQYMGGILFSLALMLLAQHWLVIFLGFISITLIYLDIRAADQEGLAKFDQAYRDYMQRVPRANILVGVVRLIKSKTSKVYTKEM